MRKQYAALTKRQKDAISVCINNNGPRAWKGAVRRMWEKANPIGGVEITLYGLRNSHGPSWLARYRHDVEI